ncbi:c-type cytochrome [Chloroflexi bacterium TSY]|nr:c-type cytochrome [Chloroflexi bacterium TSY]
MTYFGVEYRSFGGLTLGFIGILAGFGLVVALDVPLNLGTFDWPQVPAVAEQAVDRDAQQSNSLKVTAFILGIVIVIAGFASLIPQVESPAPEVLEISGALTGLELAALGESVYESAESGCTACHSIGEIGLRAPDLAGIGGQAASKVPDQSAEEYLYESLEDPCAHIVEGYECIMPPTLAQSLGPTKVTAVVAFLQSLGGEITVSLSGDLAEAEDSQASDGAVSLPPIEGATFEEISANAGCNNCHQLDAIGAVGAVGPNLSDIGARLSPDEIRESILMPDAIIAEECPAAPCAPGVMPKTLGEQLSANQLQTIVTFLSGLDEPFAEEDSAADSENETEDVIPEEESDASETISGGEEEEGNTSETNTESEGEESEED